LSADETGTEGRPVTLVCTLVQVQVQVNVKGVSLSRCAGEATKGRQSPRPLESGLAAGASPAFSGCHRQLRSPTERS